MNNSYHPSFHHVSEVELIYRSKVPSKDRPVISTDEDAHHILKNCWDENKIELVEEFKILLLNRRKACLGISHLASGGMSVCPVDPKIVFSTALKANASSIILAHNHPSGSILPSHADMQLTKRLVFAGNLLDIAVLDHIILTSDNYYSFARDDPDFDFPPS